MTTMLLMAAEHATTWADVGLAAVTMTALCVAIWIATKELR